MYPLVIKSAILSMRVLLFVHTCSALIYIFCTPDLFTRGSSLRRNNLLNNTIMMCVIFIVIVRQMGKMGGVCKKMAHSIKRWSVRHVFMVVVWIDTKPCALPPQLTLDSDLVQLNHNRISVHLKWGSRD